MSRPRRLLGLLLVVASIAAACTTDDGLVATVTGADALPVPTEANDGVDSSALDGQLVTDTCPFELPEGTAPDCYRLIVPSAWIDPVSPPVSIQVAVFPATEPDLGSADDGAALFLEGGPGGAPLEFLNVWFADAFSQINQRFDLVLFDPRGAGFSLPNLDCPEFDDLYLTDFISLADQAAALRDCANRLAADEIDIADYDSLSTARDLEALRGVLQVDAWHLIGQSYGTRLAQTYVREFPSAVRSMVLDGAYSPGAEPDDDIAGAGPALERLVDACAADEACADRFPGFGRQIGELFADAARDPIEVEGVDALTGEAYAYTVDDLALADLVFQSLYDTYSSASWPSIVEDLAAGDAWSLDLLVSNTGDGIGTGDDVGVFYSVQCRDEWAYTTPDEPANNAFGAVDELNTDAWPLLCGAWGAGTADPVEALSVEASVFPETIPTLVIGGALDPITPREDALDVVDDLGGTWVEFAQLGHGVLGAVPCADELAAAFMADPTDERIAAAVSQGACTQDHLSTTAFVSAAPSYESVTFDLTGTSVRMQVPTWIDVGEEAGTFRFRYDRLTDLHGLIILPIDATTADAAAAVVGDWFDAEPGREDRADGTTSLSGTTLDGVVVGPVTAQEIVLVPVDAQTYLSVTVLSAIDELDDARTILETVVASVEVTP